LECEVIGYGEGEESWGIEYRQIWGDPAKAETWNALDNILRQTFTTEDGRQLPISAACVDSGGHHTTAVYEYAGKRAGQRIFAVKGMAGEGKPIVSAASTKRYGRTGGSVRLFTVGVDTGKRIVMSRLGIQEGPGHCHFPMSYDEEYFAQLTAEEIRTKYLKGVPTQYWYQTRARNEALDIRVYALAAVKLLNPVWTAIKQQQSKPKQEKAKRRSGSFATNWK
ncbi:MAG: phage terminase large subunit family protein, partial [Prochlorococcus sp.]|nr:phage terminase large subunit family protein [Prochlorococcus sp.]